MKKLLIGSLAVLALATSSLTLAATDASDSWSSSTKPDLAAAGTKKAAAMGTEKVRVVILPGSTGKDGKTLKPTEVTINHQSVEGHPFTLQDGSPSVKAAGSPCATPNAQKLVGKSIGEVRVEVKNGECKSATFIMAK